MILTPDAFPEQHLQAIKVISRALKKPNFKELLKQSLSRYQVPEFLESLSRQSHNMPGKTIGIMYEK